MRDVIPSLSSSFLFFFSSRWNDSCFYREGNSMWAREMGIFVEGTICSIDFQWLRGGGVAGSKLNGKNRRVD